MQFKAVFALLVAAAPVVMSTYTPPKPAASSCSNKEFWWGAKGCCLQKGGPPAPPPPPKNTQCPSTSHYWHPGQACCVPRNLPPANSPPPQCPKGWTWNASQYKCLISTPPAPPTPPKTPPAPPTPPKTPPSPPSSCDSKEFWWTGKKCCLPHGGPPTPPTPPKGTNCPPTSHYWHPGQGCCVPSHPPPPSGPPPQCPKGWTWYPNIWKCLPTPTPPTPPPSHPSPKPPHSPWTPGWPYGNNNHKRIAKSRASKECPVGLDVCPVIGTADFECLDTSSELESCGGCASLGQGQDCTAIEGAWNVGCEQGSCQVYSCDFGFTKSTDGKSCVAV